MRAAAALVLALVALQACATGRTRGTDMATKVGLAAGVVKESEEACFPADDVRAVVKESCRIARETCDARIAQCEDGRRPGAARKFPAAECRAVEERCGSAAVICSKAIREVNAPQVEVDMKGIVKLLAGVAAVAAGALK